MTSAARVVDVRVLLDALRDAGLLVSSAPDLPPAVTDVIDDSRRVTPGSAFLAVKGAALEDLEKAPGISRAMARQLYDYFHPRG